MSGWVALNAQPANRNQGLLMFMLRSRHLCGRSRHFWPCFLFCPWLACGVAVLRHVCGGSVCCDGGYMVFSCCEDGRRFEWHSIVFEVFEQFEILRRPDFFEAAVAPLSETVDYAGDILASVPSEVAARCGRGVSARHRIGDAPGLGAELRRNPNSSAALTLTRMSQNLGHATVIVWQSTQDSVATN